MTLREPLLDMTSAALDHMLDEAVADVHLALVGLRPFDELCPNGATDVSVVSAALTSVRATASTYSLCSPISYSYFFCSG